jgi:hypothetical protein
MPAPFDHPRIIAEAGAAHPDGADASLERAHRGRRRWPRLRLPRWLSAARPTSSEGMAMPSLRDYPWRSSDT